MNRDLQLLRDIRRAQGIRRVEHTPLEPPTGEPMGALDGFLEDDSIPAAIMHSHALGRDFVLARDEAALDALTEQDRDKGLPVLFFGEAEKLSQLGLEGLRVLLDLRAEFGPAVEVQQVRGSKDGQGGDGSEVGHG